jgi:SAM-dependent methyltransferase
MNQPGITYNPHVFDVATIGDAMQIILTPEDSTTEHRWVTETPYLANLIARCFSLTEKSLVLDYGCGIGRLAKELIARHGCSVVGVDISASMRSIAVVYVGSDRFFTCPPPMLDRLTERGVAFDLALAVWVLQHCADVRDDIARITRALVPDGELFLVNQRSRAVPTVELGWVDDGLDVYALLKQGFRQRSRPARCRPSTQPGTSPAWRHGPRSAGCSVASGAALRQLLASDCSRSSRARDSTLFSISPMVTGLTPESTHCPFSRT